MNLPSWEQPERRSIRLLIFILLEEFCGTPRKQQDRILSGRQPLAGDRLVGGFVSIMAILPQLRAAHQCRGPHRLPLDAQC
jgi:hypothetical protein